MKLNSNKEYADFRGEHVFICALPNEGYDPWSRLKEWGLEKGATVEIDGREYVIAGIERFLTGTMRPHEEIGISVR